MGPRAPLPAVAPFARGATPQVSLTIEQAKKLADLRAARGESSPIGATATKPNLPEVPEAPQVPIGRIVPIRKTAAELAAEHPASAQQANPDPSVPDPAGENFLGNLANDLDHQADDGQAG